jgi:hypothetical protein
MAGSQKVRINSPIGVPGPTRDRISFSAAVVIDVNSRFIDDDVVLARLR